MLMKKKSMIAMKMKGKINSYIQQLSEKKTLHFSLIDPDKVPDYNFLVSTSKKLYDAGTSAFMVGGTLGVSKDKLDSILDILQDYSIPVILFPSNINIISEKADAIMFMSLLNSDDLYYVIGAQVVAAPIIKRLGLEILPTAYIIVGFGGTAGHVGRARVIPFDNSDLAVAYSLAAEYLGMKYVYLEAGSGSPETVRPEMIAAVKKSTSTLLMVGGGIKSADKAKLLASAGANIIVTGNLIENDIERAVKLIKAITNN
ncbi:geranylgeranylglyceryl phosphate synthase [Candidatus Acidianus copahuensis]|uniref:Geranylgeranylglyceryl phosphate synthase n=3 Tax=Acidianus TaxID=12914 RepID=A0A031LMF7_9CREN|nr:geranylgeranylglyceryl phosphate synthase [Candidatus Acidianus copahuensis]